MIRKLTAICTSVILFGTFSAMAGTWTTIDCPWAQTTRIRGRDGNKLFGSARIMSGIIGFVNSGSTWTAISVPGSVEIYVEAVSGNNIAGYYYDNAGYEHGYIYDGTTYTTLDVPGSKRTWIRGFNGSNIIGSYTTPAGYERGFSYDGINWTTIINPLALGGGTAIYGVDGNKFVGEYMDSSYKTRGYLFNGSIWSAVEPPNARWTYAFGISGNNVVGYFGNDLGSAPHNIHGFIYNGTDYTILDAPESIDTRAFGVNDNEVYGIYNASGNLHGFIYEIPKPVACIADVNQPIEAQGPWGATVTLDGSCSSDADSTPGTNDDINDFDWYKVDPCDPTNEIYIGSGEIIDCNLPLGENILILEAIDKSGLSDSNEITVTVQDTTPPEFGLSFSPNVLWPPNGKMVQITPTYDVNDLCDESPEVSILDITANEPTGADDIRITDDGSIYLCARRSGNSAGRIYTITCQACDASGNCTAKTATVTVPHNKR